MANNSTDSLPARLKRLSEAEKSLGLRISAMIDLFESRKYAASIANVSPEQLSRYTKGLNAPTFQVMARLAQSAGVSLEWVATGKGAMLPGKAQPLPGTTGVADHALPAFPPRETQTGDRVLGNTSPSKNKVQSPLEPYGGVLPVFRKLPTARDVIWSRDQASPTQVAWPSHIKQPIAIQASDNTLIREGIRAGDVCICDPDLPPYFRDAVFVRRVDHTSALAIFLGERSGAIRLEYRTLSDGKRAEPSLVSEEIATNYISQIATVVYIKRR